jgi:hypothetical protein
MALIWLDRRLPLQAVLAGGLEPLRISSRQLSWVHARRDTASIRNRGAPNSELVEKGQRILAADAEALQSGRVELPPSRKNPAQGKAWTCSNKGASGGDIFAKMKSCVR